MAIITWDVIEVPANAIVVITLQYIKVSNLHIVPLKLTQCSMSIIFQWKYIIQKLTRINKYKRHSKNKVAIITTQWVKTKYTFNAWNSQWKNRNNKQELHKMLDGKHSEILYMMIFLLIPSTSFNLVLSLISSLLHWKLF